MTTSGIRERISGTSPGLQARLAGLTAWITTSAGFSLIVLGSLVVDDNAAATAHNILSHETLYRLAVVGDLISALYIVYTFLLYNLFRPVDRSVALLGVFFSLVGVAVGMLIPLFELAALVVLRDAPSLSAFSPEQLHATALVLLTLRAQTYGVSLVLFGTYNLLTGYLIFKSTFLPRILGLLLAIAGVGYLVNTFANVIAPVFAAHLSPWILIPGGSELLLAAWLLVVGVNEDRWKAQAILAGGRRFDGR